MIIAVDAMGGDHAPGEVIKGSVQWLQENEENQLLLVGMPEVIHSELNNLSYDQSRLTIVPASEVIGMDESPDTALRRKKDASIVVASNLHKEGKADAVLSCGSTGAQMAAAIFILGRLPGIERPPIVASLPGNGKHDTLFIDVGANVDCKPVQLLQFAVLGSVYAETVLGISQPCVALLNNGEEEGKGNNLAQQTYSLLKAQEGINFLGNIEGRELFAGRADVVVCDGFVGNIVLKSIEGLGLFFINLLGQELASKTPGLERFDYTRTGGAPLLGVKGVSIVCHGSSRKEAVASGLRIAENCVKNRIVERQEAQLAKILPE